MEKRKWFCDGFVLTKKKLLFLLLFVMILPLGMLGTSNIGEVFAYNGDMQCYVQDILKFRYGILCHDYHYAFHLPSMGYGGGFFLFLSLLSFPVMFFTDNEQILLMMIRSVNVFALFGTVYILNAIMNKINGGKKIGGFHGGILTICILPSTLLLITRIHPEIFQLFLFSISILLLLKWMEYEKKRYLIYSSVAAGIMAGCKVSGIIFLIVHLILIVTAKNTERMKGKLVSLIGWGAVCCAITVVSIRPEILLSPKHGVINFLQEFRFFSNTLKDFSISEFDYYEPLEGRHEVWTAWLTHGFNHGYCHVILAAVMIVFNFYCLKKHSGVKNTAFKFNAAVLLMFILNFGYYFFTVTRVASYYIYTPMVMLILMTLINLGKIDIFSEKKIKMLSAGVVFVCLMPNFAHSFQVYVDAYQDAFKLSGQKYRYEGLKDYIKNNEDIQSILLPTSINLDITLEELHWIPWRDQLLAEEAKFIDERRVISNVQYYWTVEDLLQNNIGLIRDIGLFVIDKRNEPNDSLYEEFLKDLEKVPLYEDNDAVVYGNDNEPAPYTGVVYDISSYEKEDKGWQVVEPCNLAFPVNLNTAEEFVLTFYAKDYAVEDIRLVCKDENNIWDYRIAHSQIQKGYNEFRIRKNEFTRQSGRVSWTRINNIEIGMDMTGKVRLDDIKMVIK